MKQLQSELGERCSPAWCVDLSRQHIPDAIPIHDDLGQADRGRSSSGDVDPNPFDEPLVSEDDFTKLKGLYHRVYGFTILIWPFSYISWNMFPIVDLLGYLCRTLSRGLRRNMKNSSLLELYPAEEHTKMVQELKELEGRHQHELKKLHERHIAEL